MSDYLDAQKILRDLKRQAKDNGIKWPSASMTDEERLKSIIAIRNMVQAEYDELKRDIAKIITETKGSA